MTETSKLFSKASNEIVLTVWPAPGQSEIDAGKDPGKGAREQVSFKDGKEVLYGTKGSVCPDWCEGNACGIEVKNGNIETKGYNYDRKNMSMV